MTFLAPLFLLGALAIIGPILFHLIRRTTREVTPFSTLMFLQPSPPRITKRSRLENLWLLLLRCLALALLALAFGRPFLRETINSHLPAAGEGRRIVLLLDTSASLRREKLWDDLRAKAEERLRATTPVDEVAIVSFDGAPRDVLSFEEWRKARPDERVALARQRIGALAPGWSATRLDAALIHSAELLDQPDQRTHSEIVVLSDLQEGARLDALQGFAWPKNVTVTLDPVAAKLHENAGVAWLPESEEGGAGDKTTVRLRVTNAAEAKREQFKLRWQGGAEFDAYVPAGKARIVRAPEAPAGADRIVLTGDEADFDNTAFLLPPQTAQVPVLFIGADADEDVQGALYYLRRAFPRTARQQVEIVVHRADEAVPAFQLQRAQLIVVGAKPGAAALASAAQFVSGGKFALLPMADAASAQAAAKLLGTALPATEAPTRDYAMLAQIDFTHPLFAPFADPRFSDFTKIHFWHHRRLDLSALKDARVLAKFDSGDPALVQVPLGSGSVVLLATTWRPADSQLALSSKFLPLLHALLDQSSRLPVVRAQYFVGDEVALPPGGVTVRKPDSAEVSAETKFAQTDLPGVYAVTPGTMRFVVNLAPEESRTSPLGAERLSALGIPLSREAASPEKTAQREARAAAVELESRQKLWRWALLACFVILFLETWMSGRLSRRSTQPEASTVAS
ncbi:MAG: BatA domain-containing protein [Chthoniobacteraceae bacterium]